MIKNKRTSYGLDRRFAQINEFEESGVFEIRMPLDFKLGKNEVKLKLLPNKLLKGSEVLIDIFDATGNSIYYEISNIANEDESRSLIVYIYKDTVPGKCKIYINAVLANNKTYQCQITSDVLTTIENTQEIKFADEPKVKYTERNLQTQVFSNQTRLVNKVGTGDISILSNVAPKQIQRDNLSIEKKEITNSESTTTVSNNVGSGSAIEIPTYFQSTTLTSRNFPFSSSMEGGTLFAKNISLEIPKDNNSVVSLFLTDFSASILKVNGTGSIEIYPPFSKTVEYRTISGLTSKITYDRFYNHSNFTCSFNDILTVANSSYSQSYAKFELSNIAPVVGKIEQVEVSYKSLNQIGQDYQSLGIYQVDGRNLLTDPASVFFKNPDGIIETPIGNFRSGLTSFQNYWQTSSLGSSAITASVSSKVIDGIKLDYGSRSSTSSFAIIEPKNQYKVNVAGNQTEFNLSFDSFSESDLNGYIPQLDIYISGSEVSVEPILEAIRLSPHQSSSFGTYIGSISETFGKVRQNKFNFVVKQEGNILPKFISRVGKWHIGNIELKPESDLGFSCNQTKIYAPLSIPTGSEINFKIDYINPVGRKNKNYSTFVQGVYFRGSSGLGGGTTVLIPSGTVSGSDQLTGSFDNRYERKGTGIFSSSGQIGPTGIYSGSGDIPRNTTVYASNVKFQSSPNVSNYKVSYQYDTIVTEGNLNSPQSGSFSYSTGDELDNFRAFLNIDAAGPSIEIGSKEISASRSTSLLVTQELSANFTSQSGESTAFTLAGPDGTVFYDYRNVIKGMEYGGNYTPSLINRDRSIPDVGTVKKIVSGSTFQTGSFATTGSNLFNGSQSISGSLSVSQSIIANNYTGVFNGQPSSSAQIKVLLPTGTVSGSEQLTSSYDIRYERKGTGIVSSSQQINNLIPNIVSSSVQLTSSYDTRYHRLGTGVLSGSAQIATEISGAFIQTSSSLAGRIGSIEAKSLYSSSLQVDYNQISNKPVVSGSGLYRILLSSGSASSSYSHQNLKYDTIQSAFYLTGSSNLNGNLFQTGSSSTRMTYIWDGPKVVGVTPGIEWTNQPAAVNTWLATSGTPTTDACYIGDFTEITQGRLYTALGSIAGSTTCSLEVQYSLDGASSWTPMVTLTVGNLVGHKDSGWTRIPDGSKTFCYIRLVGWGGDGLRDPRFSPPIVLFR